MLRVSQKQSSRSGRKRLAHFVGAAISFAYLATLLACVSGCFQHDDPSTAFSDAIRTYQHGDLAAAGRKAETGYRKFHGTSSEWAWQFAILRARVLYRVGRQDEALRVLASEPQPPPTTELVAQRDKLKSDTYVSLHQFAEAEGSRDEAKKLCIGVDSPACGDLASADGLSEMERGHYLNAYGFFEQAAKSAQKHGDHFHEAIGLLSLSYSANEQTHFDEALDRANAAQKIAAANDFAGIAETALANLAWASYKLGDPDKAKEMFASAKEEAQKLGNLFDEERWLTAEGYIFMDDRDFKAAEQSFHDSLEIARKINSREDVTDALMSLAFVFVQTGKLDDAKRYADEALQNARADGNGRDVVYPRLVEGRVAARRNDPAGAEAAFREVAQSKDTPVFLKWEAERSLARLYEDEKQTSPADAEYRTALSTFEEARCGLHERVDSRLPFLSNAARIYEDYIHFLVAQGKTDEALRVADSMRARTLAEGLGRPCKPTFAPEPLNAPEIARRAGGTILFYALGQEHSYLWAITPQRAWMFPLTSNQSEIDAAVQAYREKLEGPVEIQETARDGSALYQMLVAPAQDVLKREAKAHNDNVFIIPDGGLNSLNFETLLPQPDHYWIEDVTIVNAASLRLLPATRSSTHLGGQLLLIGNPVKPDPGSDSAYPELPNAVAQMENVEKYFPDKQRILFDRNQASPTAYLNSHPEQFSYIHFVAHGTASRSSPLDSAIILSRAGATSAATAGDDSFKLYARDIIGTPRLHAELVTISACYGRGKRTYSGEGLVGLSWAFLRAGAHTVVAALWDVSDASIPQLIDDFYGELKKGKSPGVALRTAKLAMLHKSAFRSPFYWAPLQVYTGS
jgi:CHAT domain-containing protein/tetratricopeptide (TPR) repeat protein